MLLVLVYPPLGSAEGSPIGAGWLITSTYKSGDTCPFKLEGTPGSEIVGLAGSRACDSVKIANPGGIAWLYQAGQITSDVTVEADLGYGGSWAGVACRGTSSSFYGFLIGGSGNYKIVRNSRSGEVVLASGQSAAIPVADPTVITTYRVDAACRGTTLSLFVNNVKIASTTDTALSSGWYGVVIEGGDPRASGIPNVGVDMGSFRAAIPVEVGRAVTATHTPQALAPCVRAWNAGIGGQAHVSLGLIGGSSDRVFVIGADRERGLCVLTVTSFVSWFQATFTVQGSLLAVVVNENHVGVSPPIPVPRHENAALSDSGKLVAAPLPPRTIRDVVTCIQAWNSQPSLGRMLRAHLETRNDVRAVVEFQGRGACRLLATTAAFWVGTGFPGIPSWIGGTSNFPRIQPNVAVSATGSLTHR
jgi:hypothetical protein